MTTELEVSLSALSADDKRRVIELLADQLDAGEDEQPSDEFLAELERRSAASKVDPSRLVKWEDVKARLLAKYGR